MFLHNAIVTDIVNVKIDTVEVGKRWQMRNRYACAIIFAPHGSFQYTQDNGQVYLSDPTHAIFLPEGANYHAVCDVPDHCLVINFRCNRKFEHIRNFKITDSKALISEFQAHADLWIRNRSAYHYRFLAFTYRILALLAEENEAQERELPDFLQRAERYISAHLGDPDLGNDTLAGVCNVSTVYFRKAFLKHFACAPMHYVHAMRMRLAADYLKEPFLSVGEVAASVGYRSIYSFSRAFKQSFGICPEEYRKFNA